MPLVLLVIIKVKANWFHVRERGVFGAIFGTLISFGVYFAFEWGQAIVDITKVAVGADSVVAAVLRRRWWTAVALVALAAIVHVTTGLWFAVLIWISQFSSSTTAESARDGVARGEIEDLVGLGDDDEEAAELPPHALAHGR